MTLNRTRPSHDLAVRPYVVRPSEAQWQEAARSPEEVAPPGVELTGFESADGRFTFGVWERDLQEREFERPYDEVALILEGEVELLLDDGTTIRAVAGDILVTPNGTKARWRSRGRTRKVWAIYESSST
jgi:uncharacterized cupin superfamily protein